MATLDVPWPTTAAPGKRPGESQGDLINAYATKRGEQLEIRRTPGLRRFLEVSAAPQLARGMFATQSRLYHVFGNTLRWRNTSGTDGLIAGLVPGADPVAFAVNVRPDGTTQFVLVANGVAYEVDENANTLEPHPSALPLVTDVEFFSGYFIFLSPTNQMLASDLRDITVDVGASWQLTEYAADPLVRLKGAGDALFAFGTRTIEVWMDVAASPFPLQRQTALDTGLLGPHAVAGGTNQWGNGILFAASDYTVRRIMGHEPKVISNDDVSADIFAYKDRPKEILAQVYDFEQQSVFTLTTADWTWEYNLVTNVWHRRDSYGLPYWRGLWATNWQNRWYVQDTKAARIHQVMVNEYEEDGDRLRWRVESAPIKDFPQAMRIPTLDIDMTNALGGENVPSPYLTDPAVMVSWSKDGGATWSRPVARSLGKIGRYAQKVTVNGLGRSTAQGLRIRLDVIDPVPAVLRGAVARGTTSRARQVEN